MPSADLVFARAGEVDLAYDDSVIVNALLRGLQRAEVAAARVAYDSDPADAVRAPAPGLGALKPDSVLRRAYLHPYHIQVALAEYPLVSEPGTRYDYSNVNAELIAPIIERATGRRYDHWVSAEVLAPLGASGGDTWINRPGGIPHSGCCSRLPAETYLRLALLLLNDGVREGERLLPEGYVQQMLTPSATNPHAGMGLYVAGPYVEGRGAANPDIAIGKTPHGEAYLDRDLWLFDGNANQVVYVIPRHELVILRVGDRPPKSRPWGNTELPNRLLRALHAGTGAELVPQEDPLAVSIPTPAPRNPARHKTPGA